MSKDAKLAADAEASVVAPDPGDTIYQVKVTLRHSAKPPIWRRLLIPANIPLSRVHTTIQVAMGWEDAHLHAFTVGDTRYGSALDGDTPSDDEVTLSAVATRAEALADPAHEDHAELLDWLGLEDPDEFDPAHVDLERVNRTVALA